MVERGSIVNEKTVVVCRVSTRCNSLEGSRYNPQRMSIPNFCELRQQHHCHHGHQETLQSSAKPDGKNNLLLIDLTMNGGPKENANPTILDVENRQSHSHFAKLDWSDFGNFSKELYNEDSDDDAAESLFVPRSSFDKMIFEALSQISENSGGKGVSILEGAGLNLHKVSTKVTGDLQPMHLLGQDIYGTQVSMEEGKEGSTLDKDSEESIPRSRITSDMPYEPIDAEEVFEIIRNIQDPEHPNTLEQLSVVSLPQIKVYDARPDLEKDPKTKTPLSTVEVRFTPTIPHCSMATLIGLCLKVKLLRSLPRRFKISVQIEPGTHASENAINKQLRDKERVCAALENKHLLGVVNKCIKNGMETPML